MPLEEKGLKVFEKNRVIDDAVTLFLNKQIYYGFTDVQITRELNVAACDFSASLTDRWRADQKPWSIFSGMKVHIHSTSSIYTGYIDNIEVSLGANERNIVITGRSQAGDLVDCSIVGENEFSGLNLQEIAIKLCEPFSIKVVFLTSPGAAFDKITVQTGESVFALLDRLTRQRKLVMYSGYNGELVFSTAGRTKVLTELKQGTNVLRARMKDSMADRFSDYVVKGQNLSFLGDAKQATSPEGAVKDLGVPRHRPLVVVNETATDGNGAEDRAAYEMGVRLAKSLEVEVEIVGWHKPDGTYWDINELVPVDIPFLGIRRILLIKKVVYNKNSQTTAILTLVRPESFDFQKQVKKKKADELGYLKGFKRER